MRKPQVHIKTHSLENNDEVERSLDYDEHHYLGPHFEGSTAGWHWHTSLLYRHAFSPSEIVNLFHNASPPTRSHSASCGHIESLLSDTSADRPSRFTADGGKSKTGCQISSDPLKKSSLVHSTLSSNTAKNGRPLSCIQSWMSSKHKQWRWCPLKPCRLYCSQKEVSRLWWTRFMCHVLTSQQRHAAYCRLHFRR